MQKFVNKKYLKSHHYKDDSKLVFRKKFNSFAKPRVQFGTKIIDIIKKVEAKRVLDVGCGNGDLLIQIRKTGFKGELYGIDISGGIIMPGIKQNAKEKLNISLKVGDAENLYFKSNHFDIIVAKHMLYHLAHVQKGINEIYRCLKPGGIFIITLNSRRDKPQLCKCEKLICKKYKLKTEHGKDVVNVENVKRFLSKFSNIKTSLSTGKVNKPELFTQYFATFKDSYSPTPNQETWSFVLKDVDNFVKRQIKNKGKFIETCVTGLIIATK
ncbi:MAG: class I SAM-dependent methyltransferase [Patescibacteria group bacterium]